MISIVFVLLKWIIIVDINFYLHVSYEIDVYIYLILGIRNVCLIKGNNELVPLKMEKSSKEEFGWRVLRVKDITTLPSY